jgi:hypothetical protein
MTIAFSRLHLAFSQSFVSQWNDDRRSTKCFASDWKSITGRDGAITIFGALDLPTI